MVWLKWTWCSFHLWLELRRFRFLGWWHGLPSLSQYTDAQVIEGLKRLRQDCGITNSGER